MTYVLRHRLLSLGRSYTIQDDSGHPRFQVESEILSFGHRHTFLDLNGNALAVIEKRLLAFRPTFRIFRPGGEVDEVTRRLSFFGERFVIDVAGDDDYEVRGDIFNHEYVVTRAGQEVAVVSKQWFSFSDTYGVQVATGEDDVLLLAAAVVIDEINEEREHDQGFPFGL